MKFNMADNSDDYFDVGEFVSCETCHGEIVEGEVMAFDFPSKTLVIKSAGSNGKHNCHDVRLLNLAFVRNVKTLKEAHPNPPPLNGLNHSKIANRVQKNIEEKRRQVSYIGVGVTPLAQRLFHHITKTITEVRWEGQSIIVLDEVRILPPYLPENVVGVDGVRAVSIEHVRKLVDKYHGDEARESPSSTGSS